MVSDQYRVEAVVDLASSDDGGLSGFFPSPVTSFLVEPEDGSVLGDLPHDSFGAVVIDVVGRPDLHAGMTRVDVVVTFLDGARARKRLRSGMRFHLRLGSRRIGVGTVGGVVRTMRSAS